MGDWNTSHPHTRQWRRVKHRRHRLPQPWLRYGAMVIAGVLTLALAWRGIRWTERPYAGAITPVSASYSPLPASADSNDARDTAWQHDFSVVLDSAAQLAADGQPGSAEVAVDRAETILTTQRLVGGEVKPEFFAPALAALDRIASKRPDDVRLREHVTLARISLAELRSSIVAEPAVTLEQKRVSIGVPRELAAGDTLDPASFGGSILDATIMPGTAEILLPPASRSFADDVHVENLVVQGAAQTLDGVRWRNVIFVDTRLRYEGGELSLDNVQFVRCRFGFTTEEGSDRGARLATAIAEGKTSITIP